MLDDQQKGQYERDGWAVCPDFLSSKEITELVGEIETTCQGSVLANHDKHGSK